MSWMPVPPGGMKCYSGGSLDETPRAFKSSMFAATMLKLAGSELHREIGGAEWRVFTVRSEQDEIFLLRQNRLTGEWEVQAKHVRESQ